jgi:hypothetical protein
MTTLHWFDDGSALLPTPEDFDSTHTAWIWFLDHDARVTGTLVRRDPATGAPEAWCIEEARIGEIDVTELLWADEQAMRAAEAALDVQRMEEWS